MADPVVLNESMRKLSSGESKRIDNEVLFFDVDEDPNTTDNSNGAIFKRNRRRRTRAQR